MARLTVAEALTNLVFAAVSPLDEIKCSANWMWAAKLEGEGAAMYDACEAMSTFMKQLGVAVDGGKDSLSMAARVGDETVKAPRRATRIATPPPPTDASMRHIAPPLLCRRPARSWSPSTRRAPT